MIQMPRFPDWIFINDETLSRSEVNNLVVSDMEMGPQKTRPLQSNPMFLTNIDISFVSENHDDWILFKKEIKYGASWFTMRDPFNGRKIKARIKNNDVQMSKRGNLIFIPLQIESYNDL